MYISHLLIKHPNFVSESSYGTYFCKKEILIQPPGKPREHNLGEVRAIS